MRGAGVGRCLAERGTAIPGICGDTTATGTAISRAELGPLVLIRKELSALPYALTTREVASLNYYIVALRSERGSAAFGHVYLRSAVQTLIKKISGSQSNHESVAAKRIADREERTDFRARIAEERSNQRNIAIVDRIQSMLHYELTAPQVYYIVNKQAGSFLDILNTNLNYFGSYASLTGPMRTSFANRRPNEAEAVIEYAARAWIAMETHSRNLLWSSVSIRLPPLFPEYHNPPYLETTAFLLSRKPAWMPSTFHDYEHRSGYPCDFKLTARTVLMSFHRNSILLPGNAVDDILKCLAPVWSNRYFKWLDRNDPLLANGVTQNTLEKLTNQEPRNASIAATFTQDKSLRNGLRTVTICPAGPEGGNVSMLPANDRAFHWVLPGMDRVMQTLVFPDRPKTNGWGASGASAFGFDVDAEMLPKRRRRA